jgi:hypothetical protein
VDAGSEHGNKDELEEKRKAEQALEEDAGGRLRGHSTTTYKGTVYMRGHSNAAKDSMVFVGRTINRL